MITIPDAITLLYKKSKPTRDFFYSICESIGSRLSNWAWNKRWNNREKGTGYKK